MLVKTEVGECHGHCELIDARTSRRTACQGVARHQGSHTVSGRGRAPFRRSLKAVMDVDRDNLARMNAIFSTRGFPTAAQGGCDAVVSAMFPGRVRDSLANPNGVAVC